MKHAKATEQTTLNNISTAHNDDNNTIDDGNQRLYSIELRTLTLEQQFKTVIANIEALKSNLESREKKTVPVIFFVIRRCGSRMRLSGRRNVYKSYRRSKQQQDLK